jgi:hypothetical protein
MISLDGTSLRTSPASGLENDILKVLLYFDVFRFPLTAREIFHFLPSNSITPSHVSAALQGPSLREMVTSENGYFFVSSVRGSYADERIEKERRAARLMKIARVMGKIISMFPYVRGVFLSGELSKGIASKKSDIDFVVVTQEGRLWIARTLLILFKKMFLLNRKRFFCVNHFVTAEHLRVDLRNIYTATEVATLLPLENDALFSWFLQENAWITQFFPNWKFDGPNADSRRRKAGIIRNMLERVVPDRIASRLDRWLLSKWKRVWETRYAHLAEDERNRKYQCTEYLSTAYGEDYQEYILNSFQVRLREYNVV